jgi:CPA2 family monovalent cation:H+ antiporter-2
MSQTFPKSIFCRTFVLILFAGIFVITPSGISAQEPAQESFADKTQKFADNTQEFVGGIQEVFEETKKLVGELRTETAPGNENTITDADKEKIVEAGKKIEESGKELIEVALGLEKAGHDIVSTIQKSAKLPPLPDLIRDLGLILIAATVMLLLFKWIKQPIILGYLLAGFIISPYFLTNDPSHPLYESYAWLNAYLGVLPKIISISDKENIHIWAEIGVIFMLFGLGLEFSFKKLIAFGRIACITGGFEVFSTTIIGYIFGKIMGWNDINSLFFGAMLAMSSTTIILKVFEELRLKGKSYAPIVFGGLIVEDILAILLLVLLGSISISGQLDGWGLASASLQLVYFMLLWFVMGIFLIPWFLKKCRKIINDEILLLISVGSCFLMVIIACDVGFSAELGAFVMGSILAETARGTHIEHVTKPVKDLFSAVFFVSIGMKLDPVVLYDYSGTILLVLVLTIVVKFIGTGLGALLAGCSLQNSMKAGLSMAQIGEFSFILATLGVTLGVLYDWMFPVIIAVSAITALTTPYLILSAETVSRWLDHWVPERVHLLLLRYEVVMNESIGRENVLLLFWRTHGLAITLNSVVVIGIGLAGWVMFGSLTGPQLFLAALPWFIGAAIFALPFLAGVFRSRPLRVEQYDIETLERLKQLQFGVVIFRFFIGFVLVVFLTGSFIGFHTIEGMIATTIIIGFLYLFGGVINSLYYNIESRFLTNLDKERAVVGERSALAHLAPWEATLTEFTVSEYSPLVMKTLQESNLKQNFGVTVAIIRRGEKDIVAPQADEKILPCDRLHLIGTYDQLALAQAVIELRPEHAGEEEFDDHQFGMLSLRLHAGNPFVGKTIRDCGIREAVNGLIVGIERGGTRHLNPQSDMELHANDILWLVGERVLITKLQRESVTNATAGTVARGEN